MKLNQQKEVLKEKVETLQLLNDKILALDKDDEIEEEIEEADRFRETFQLAFGRIEAALSSQPSCAHLTDASNVGDFKATSDIAKIEPKDIQWRCQQVASILGHISVHYT